MSTSFSRFHSLASALPIFLAALLLFSVEPMTAKRILPWFGGSAAVWSTCLVFYQSALLLGYAYAAWLSLQQNRRAVQLIHVVLLLISLAFLPIGPGALWSHPDLAHPARAILWLLIASIGLPFLMLASTSPLLQDWAARAGVKVPYRLFAISNLASLCALLAYPVAIEPLFALPEQRAGWSWIYAAFVLLFLVAVFRSHERSDWTARHRNTTLDSRWLSWFALSACGATLLLSVTNHITENVAAVPLLWVLPLAVYLLTFILAFAQRRAFHRALWLRLLAFALAVLAYSIYEIDAIEAIQVSLPVFLIGLFICCYFCHAELHRQRPDPKHLTTYYLAVAAGGAVGGIAVGLLAPAIFRGVYELPLALTFTALLALALVWRSGAWPLRALWVAVSCCMAATVVSHVRAYAENTLAIERSFYGSLRVTQTPHAGPDQVRTLFHGTIEHGAQFVQLPRRRRPTTYYGPESGVGVVLRNLPFEPKRVGVVGLGAGTIAAYGHPGDTFRFFELNPQVIDLAQSLFWYTRESKAHIEIEAGDGRLLLERDSTPRYQVLVLDAFSGDAIPIHLLTLEAMRLYRERLSLDGVLAVHVSNDFVDLTPVVFKAATQVGWLAVLVHNHSDASEAILPSDWVLVTNNQAILQDPEVLVHTVQVSRRPQVGPWTDAYSNLLLLLKSPSLSFGPSRSR